MTVSNTAVSLPALAALRDQIAALNTGAVQEVRAGHLDLGADLWLSSDPDSQTRMQIGPGENGLRLELRGGDSGRWACLGMRLQPAELQQAQYAGVILALSSADLISYRPTLRYFLPEGGFQDVVTPDPVVMVPGQREICSYISVDAERAARASAAELNLFFLEDGFCAESLRLEPVLML